MKTCKRCERPSEFHEKVTEGQLGFTWCKECVRAEYARQAAVARAHRAAGTDNGVLICPSCLEFKPEKDFYPSALANSRIGYIHSCASCSKKSYKFYSERAKAAKGLL